MICDAKVSILRVNKKKKKSDKATWCVFFKICNSRNDSFSVISPFILIFASNEKLCMTLSTGIP